MAQYLGRLSQRFARHRVSAVMPVTGDDPGHVPLSLSREDHRVPQGLDLLGVRLREGAAALFANDPAQSLVRVVSLSAQAPDRVTAVAHATPGGGWPGS